MARWPRNICEDCKYKWNPRGHRLAAQCPKCKSLNVHIYRNWLGFFIVLHLITFLLVIFINSEFSLESILSSLKAKRGWSDSSGVDANAYIWKFGKIFAQCALVYVIYISILIFKNASRKTSDSTVTIRSLPEVHRPVSMRKSAFNKASNRYSHLAKWDVFISHASEDKDDFVRPLANVLRRFGFKVWYDEFTLKIGDSLRRSIDRGLANSRFGIVVVSPNFLKKEWPQRELDGLVSLEANERRIILPVWHNIDLEGVREFSPILADRLAVSSSIGIDKIAQKLADVISND